jgi:hypothetical protein
MPVAFSAGRTITLIVTAPIVETVETTVCSSELVLGFHVGRGRNCISLWKPAIDSLEAIVGRGPRRFHPRDGLVVRLGLSCVVDESLGWMVEIDLAWRPAAVSNPG